MVNKFRVSLLGIRVFNGTWDHALEVDGKGDEIYVDSEIRLVDDKGNAYFYTQRKSRIMGDINGYGYRVKAGSASPKGGIKTGDDIPYSDPYLQKAPLTPDKFPMLIYEGEISDTEALTILPSIWEWDGGEDIFNAWTKHITNRVPKIISASLNIINASKSGKIPSSDQLKYSDFIKSNLEIGLQSFFGLLSDITGQAKDRPIGMIKEGDNVKFNGPIIILTSKIASLVSKKNFGLGPGVFEITFKDDPSLWGNYTLYGEIEQIQADIPEQNWWRPWIRFLYKDLLDREPENDNVITDRITALKNGETDINIAKGFLYSYEYSYKFAYWKLYKHFLNRDPEKGAAEALAERLMNQYPINSAIINFCDSEEYKNHLYPVPEKFVKSLYTKLLNREGEPDGVNYYVKEITEKGVSTANVINNFLRSPEYRLKLVIEYLEKLDIAKFVEEYLEILDKHSEKLHMVPPLKDSVADHADSPEYRSKLVLKYLEKSKYFRNLDILIPTKDPIEDYAESLLYRDRRELLLDFVISDTYKRRVLNP